jgi:serine protease inhibitor
MLEQSGQGMAIHNKSDACTILVKPNLVMYHAEISMADRPFIFIIRSKFSNVIDYC